MGEYADTVRDGIRTLLKERIKSGDRFSLTTDEYTKMVKKFANLNIHLPGGDTVAIGMIRVRGTLPAERAKDMLCNKLHEFCISEDEHLVATTKDGAVCRKFL